MPTYALLVFALAAVFGLVLASRVLRGQFAPWALSLLHAAFGATGLILLIIMLLKGSPPQRMTIAFVLLLIAALGGFLLASFHLRQKLPPKGVVFSYFRVQGDGFTRVVKRLRGG